MTYYVIKLLVSAALIVLVSEVSKRNTMLGALFLSLPTVSLLAIFWLYSETKDVNKVSALATGTFWLVIPSLVFFVVLPFLLKARWEFYSSMAVAAAGTALSYFAMLSLLKKLGINL